VKKKKQTAPPMTRADRIAAWRFLNRLPLEIVGVRGYDVRHDAPITHEQASEESQRAIALAARRRGK